MMEEQVRQIVKSAIDTTCPHPLGRYHLCWWQDQIQCRPIDHTTKAHPVFLTMIGHVLTAGLSPHGWQVLTSRIIHFCANADLTHNEPAVGSVDARGNASGKRTGRRRRCSQKMHAPVNAPWFKVWAGPGSRRPW